MGTSIRQKLGEEGMVIWYDSVTIKGELQWQDEVNDKNFPFFNACHGIFLNYCWKTGGLNEKGEEMPDNLGNSLANLDKRLSSEVYVGVDVFGRGCLGGGGFDTKVAVEAVCNYDFSVALFAPGWTWECASNPDANDFHHRDSRFWGLLHPWLPTHGVSLDPAPASTVGVGHSEKGVGGKSDGSVFRSCFGLGHGRGRPAPQSSSLLPSPWFNLKMMQFQPSFTTTALEEGEVEVVENRSRLMQSHILSLTTSSSTNSSTTLPLLLLHLCLNKHSSLLVTMLVKRSTIQEGKVEGVGIRLGLADGNEESLEEVSLEMVESRKLEFGFLPLAEELVEDEDWVEIAFEAPPSKARVVEKLGIHLPSGLNQVEIASLNISTAKL